MSRALKSVKFHPNINFAAEDRKACLRLEKVTTKKKKEKERVNESQDFFNSLVNPVNFVNVAAVFANEVVFRTALENLFQHLGLPNPNVGAYGNMNEQQNNLVLRLVHLLHRGFGPIQQDQTALQFFNSILDFSKREGHYVYQQGIKPKEVTPDNTPTRRNRGNGDGGAGGGAGGAVNVGGA